MMFKMMSLLIRDVAGALITLDGGRYLYAQMFSGVAMIIGVGFLQAARVLKVGWRWDAKV